MKILSIEVGCMKCKKPNNHKWDVFVTVRRIDRFGKEYQETKLWDTCLNSELESSMIQAKRYNHLEGGKTNHA